MQIVSAIRSPISRLFCGFKPIPRHRYNPASSPSPLAAVPYFGSRVSNAHFLRPSLSFFNRVKTLLSICKHLKISVESGLICQLIIDEFATAPTTFNRYTFTAMPDLLLKLSSGRSS